MGSSSFCRLRALGMATANACQPPRATSPSHQGTPSCSLVSCMQREEQRQFVFHSIALFSLSLPISSSNKPEFAQPGAKDQFPYT